jgi:hypothetical protein
VYFVLVVLYNNNIIVLVVYDLSGSLPFGATVVGMIHMTENHVCVYAKFFSYVHRVLLPVASITEFDARGSTLHIVSIDRCVCVCVCE